MTSVTITDGTGTATTSSPGAASIRLVPSPEPVPSPEIDALALLDYRERRRAVSAAGAPPGRYLAFEGKSGTLLVPLCAGVTHIGRGLPADIRLDHPRVARLHAIVVQHPQCARALAGHSDEGLLVNGRRVAAMALRDGDLIGLGRIVVRFIEVAASRDRDPADRDPRDRTPQRESPPQPHPKFRRRPNAPGRPPAHLPAA